MQGDERDHFARLTKAVAETRDQAAFTLLFDHFAPRLKSWLTKRGMKTDEAEELVQEVMTILWHRANLYDPRRSSLSTWLFRIARNRRIDAQRRAKTRTLEGREPLLQLIEVPGVDTLFESEERDARVRQALSQIPDEQMELIRAAFFLGQTHSEIAASTGLPLGTVKSRIRLAFERLRRVLDEPASGE
ncbi:sigma-70 family RNA polymerase sigma factor [Neorhizobium alkalisoli]|jgi:RNA polymerase sigma-70 factor (ECF subfamily)|uniref:RNA polymerase sigma-70 factor (ECF subfamily) n=1 Tax=Neorhizobium alkalisoli TaxID=528178 RepID=A0A561QIN2_9HYPH|nr:sigma-70 family RNA polymerase sigma factor [Neorhizobium alkalisoli]TWF50224.1 RNA polymerase sigma-70 factor (ECF subfamily) [Neorhizobium alkalisoli]